MNTHEDLFIQRLKQAWNKGIRYCVLIARGLHLIPLFLILLVYFGYKAFLGWLPADFPAYLFMALIISWTLTQTGIRTYLKEPDPVFLLPAQSILITYFRYSLVYSAFVQVFKTTLWMAFLFPLYIDRIGGMSAFALSLITVVALKLWNVQIRWLEIQSGSHPGLALFLRGVTNLLATVWLFYGGFFGIPLIIAIVWLALVLFFYWKRTHPSHIIAWERLLAEEQRTVARYYRLANQFVDVPFVGNQVKNPPWLRFIYRWIPFGSKNTYLYLYLRTFIRYSEPLGSVFRLTLVTSILLTFMPAIPWFLTSGLFAGGLYLTAIQLPWIRRIHRYQPWFRLYPLPEQQKQTDLSRLLSVLLGVQGTLILLPPLLLQSHSYPLLLTLLGAGWVIAFFFSYVHLPVKQKKFPG
ncbi:ABC transporter permease [Paludifilum halophilum]|uniref:ABC transporter permease n=1 Tax=Paludifilum halophilum TaxID=1642702 RepID=A0A235B7I4_9BACL|nr:ABC transporter permease [Paludifilum halophilum]OYD08264.1 hypothetical protein CHM34_05270 [Paludifilum halophilum]